MPTFPTVQVLRILLGHAKDLPAILEAVDSIKDADGLYDGWDAVKHLGDLLLPVAVEIQEQLGDRELSAAFDPAELDQLALAESGIDWQRVIDALPKVVEAVKLILILLAK